MHATETKIVTTATASNLRGSNSSYLSSRKHLSPPTSPVRMGTSGAFSPLQVVSDNYVWLFNYFQAVTYIFQQMRIVSLSTLVFLW